MLPDSPEENGDKKFCVDCKWCDMDWRATRSPPGYPMHENNMNKWRYMCQNKKTSFVDLVTGKTTRPTCKDARSIGGTCGMHACYFEVKIEKNVLDINQVTSADLEERRDVD